MESTTERYEWTPRQRQVLDLLTRGYTNAQIAETLGVSLDGAKWHVREIISILGVDGREDAAEYWRRQNGLAARFSRLVQALWFLPRLGLAKAIVAGVVVLVPVGVAIAVADAMNGTGPDAEVAAVVSASPLTLASPTPAPVATLATGRLCIAGDLLIGSDERIENGAFVYEARITKPRGCDLTGPIEAFVVEDAAAGFQGARLLTERAGLVAPVGTDRVFVTVTWQNWCRVVPTPRPTVQRVPGGVPDFPPSNPLWVAWSAISGSGTGQLYPACTAPTTPTTLTIATRSEPDPPAVASAISASPAPVVSSAADLEAFARWFAIVVAARDETALEAIMRPIAVTCPGTAPSGSGQSNPLCRNRSDGQSLTGYVMDQSGQLGLEDTFRVRLMETTAASGALRAAGCAVDAPACERFVVAFEAVQGQRGSGSYQAYVFEVVDDKVALRGLYPGGGDRDTVFAGGVARTPWGEARFVPQPAVGP